MPKALKPVRLSPADFERTLRLLAEVRVAELEAAIAVERAKRRVTAAKDAHAAHMRALAKRHRGFKAEDVNYTIDEATRTLTPDAGGPQT